ncbi:MAG: hypothetical protein SH809_18690 [Rhodothermales bacterium]|nr:hypothetical protein [Rhodothermales bacterium]
MEKKISLGTTLLIVLIAVAGALFAYRAWFDPSSGDIDRENRELFLRLERSQAMRDSLQTLIGALQTELDELQSREGELLTTRDSLGDALVARNNRIRALQQNITRYDHSADSLVRDLNHILARLYADSSADSP